MRQLNQLLCITLVCMVLSPVCRGGEAVLDGMGRILYEAWPGLTPDMLKHGDGWVNTPGEVKSLSEFNYWQQEEKQLASRLSAMVTIPADGDYRFYVTARNKARLYVALDGNPDHIKLMVDLTESGNRNNWTKGYEQKSDPVPLKKGTSIFLTVIHFVYKSPRSHVTAGWSRDNGPVEVIPPQHCYIPWESWGAVNVEKPTVFGKGPQFIELQWPRVNYGLGVLSFNVYRNGTLLADDVKRYRFLDKTVVAGKTYSYSVQAVDLPGRTSAKSQKLTVTVPKASNVNADGTGLTAGFYLLTTQEDRKFEVRPKVKGAVDAKTFLNNRKAEATYLQGVVPSFKWYRDHIFEVADFTNRPVRLEGFIEVPYDGEWTFTLRASDKIQFWINQQLLVDKLFLPGERQETGVHQSRVALNLKSGEKIPFRLESDLRTFQVEWEHILREREPIPIEHLYPSSTLGTESFKCVSGVESYTNPVHLEIRVGSEVTSVIGVVDGVKKAAIRLDSYRYLFTENDALGVQLKPDVPTLAEFSLKGKTQTAARNLHIRWVPIVLGRKTTPKTLTIRQGDELFFKTPSGGIAKNITLIENDTPRVVTASNGRVTFNKPGTFIVRDQVAASPPLTITVIPRIKTDVIALMLSKFRYWEIPKALRGLYVEPADDRMIEMSHSKHAQFPNCLLMRPPAIGPSYLVFREQATGPVLASVSTDAFYRWPLSFKSIRPGRNNWHLCHWNVGFSHIIPGTSVQMVAFTSHNLKCENGSWHQRYDLVDNGNNMFGVPIIREVSTGWCLFNTNYFQKDRCLSIVFPGMEP